MGIYLSKWAAALNDRKPGCSSLFDKFVLHTHNNYCKIGMDNNKLLWSKYTWIHVIQSDATITHTYNSARKSQTTFYWRRTWWLKWCILYICRIRRHFFRFSLITLSNFINSAEFLSSYSNSPIYVLPKFGRIPDSGCPVISISFRKRTWISLFMLREIICW